MRHPVPHDHVQQLVTVVDAAFVVGQHDAIAVAVQRDSQMGPVLANQVRQPIGVYRAHAVVDVESVGRGGHCKHLGAQLMEDIRSHVVGGAVGAIDHELEPFEVDFAGKPALAELDVATRRVVQPTRLAQLGGCHAGRRCLQYGLDLLLDAVIELLAEPGKKFDAVVLVWVVRGTDHHAGG